MDRVRELIAARIREKGLDMAKASRAMKKNHAYMQQYLTNGKPKKLPEEVREALAKVLDVDADELRETKPGNQPLTPVAQNASPSLNEATEEQIMDILRFLKRLREKNEDAFDEAVARLVAEQPKKRPPLAGTTS